MSGLDPSLKIVGAANAEEKDEEEEEVTEKSSD